MMKKRTVITTEKREVWVIGQASDGTAERADKDHNCERDADSLPAFPSQNADEPAANGDQK